ncbi:MAG: STAS domain-containing protein [Leptospiraceae bacterium]|nr:STAS domain-containing protein [Leptospiraceae bacterium]
MKLTIKLPSSCTIRNVEEVREKVFDKFKGLEKLNLIIDVNDIEKLDTTFFQFLLSIKKYVEMNNSEFHIIGNSESLHNIMLYYGIQL